MPKWLIVALILVAVLVAGMMRERWRLRAMEKWVRERGFILHSPFVPADRPPMAALAAKLEGRNARIWGAGIEGNVDGVQVTIAEHETPAKGVRADGGARTTGIWRVMMAWPVRGGHDPDPSALASWPHGGEVTGDGDWAAWRVRGNLTQANVKTLLAHLPEARRLFE